MHKFKKYFKKISIEEYGQGAEILARQRSRVDFQVSFLTAIIVIISCYLIFFLNYYFTYNNMIKDLQNRALNIHNFLEVRLDKETFTKLNSREDSDTLTYQRSKSLLEEIKNVADVRYLYTAKKTDEGDFIYVIDGLSENSSDFRYIGDPIEPECIPDMKAALNGRTVLPKEINKTTWGPIFITYFPIHEGDNIIGVVGIEFDAERQYDAFQTMMLLTPIVIIIFCLISAFIALKMFHRISNPSYRDITTIDFLTGLKNRNSFEIDLNNIVGHSELYSISLLSMDLDDLKQVNDIYGHEMGDSYIKLGANIIRESIAPEDIAYRMGGDEFSVIMKNKNPKQIEEIQQNIKIREKEYNETQLFTISISTGYALFDSDMDKSLFDTLKRADAAMYEQKRAKKAAKNNSSVKPL